MDRKELQSLIRARETLLWIVTREERRVEREIYLAAGSLKQKIDGEELPVFQTRFWDCADGGTDYSGNELQPTIGIQPTDAFDAIKEDRTRAIWVMRDLPPWFDLDFTIVRRLKSLARELQGEKNPLEYRAIVVLTPRSRIPEELQGVATVIEWPLPTRDEIGEVVDSALRQSGAKLKVGRDDVIDASVGLTIDQAGRCFARSLVESRTIDPTIVSAEKKRVISGEAGLEWFDPEPKGLDAIGGLENVKAWTVRRRAALSKEARDFGLPAPRGILVTGIPGCGKSLLAKSIPSAWGIPLLRLDLSATRSKFVGESEAKLRRAFTLAETVAPCVLWVDEIEKALAGSAPGASADGGVASDALGAFLTFLQESKAPVFVVATCNDVMALPPELLRRGRFDEVFWVDLPNADEREAVLAATLKKFDRELPDVTDGDLRAFTKTLDGWSGAEIASLVPEALFEAYEDGKRDLTLADLEKVSALVEPQSKSQSERLAELRRQVSGKVAPASRKAAEEVAEDDGFGARFVVA